ncbi:MAG: PqqD family protein [Armatimonadota bacterium]|jgi:hypothetical protein
MMNRLGSGLLRRRQPRLTTEQVLQSRPLRNQALKTEEIDGGGLRLTIPRRREWWAKILAVVFPIPKERRLELDEAGREVWDLCDGEHTLREMIKVFQDRHKLTRAEAEWSLRTYLRDLGKRNLIFIAIEKPAQKKQ